MYLLSDGGRQFRRERGRKGGGYFPTVFREGSQINVTLSKDWLLLGEEWSILVAPVSPGPRGG